MDMAAVALDAFMKIVLPNKEMLERYLDKAAESETKRMKKLVNFGAGKELDDAEITERLRNDLIRYIDSKHYSMVSSPLFKLDFDPQFLAELAEEYKQLLLSRGYGLIQYKNTNPKETRGIQDKNSYIALTKPKSIFSETGELNEGWRDWAMGAGLGAMALGGGMAAYDATKKPEPTPQVQVQEPVAPPVTAQLPSKQLKPLERVLANTAMEAGIEDDELKQFLAQCAHETLDFTTLEELGTDRYITKKYDKRFNPKKAKILGNINPGDGLKYKGRGFIQLTGRYNYKKAGEALGLPLEQQPELVERPDVAAKVAVWFWQHRVQPKVQDFTNVRQSTRPINPSMKGLQSRQAKFNKYAQVSIPTTPTQPRKKT